MYHKRTPPTNHNTHTNTTTQLFSPAYGHQRAVPRLPSNNVDKGQKLWRLGERISAPHLKAHRFSIEEERACCWLPLPVAGGKGQEVVVKEAVVEEEGEQQLGEEEEENVMAHTPGRGGMGLVGKEKLSPSSKIGGVLMEGERVLSEPAQ